MFRYSCASLVSACHDRFPSQRWRRKNTAIPPDGTTHSATRNIEFRLAERLHWLHRPVGEDRPDAKTGDDQRPGARTSSPARPAGKLDIVTARYRSEERR